MPFWVGGSGNITDAAAHWAATSGGAPGAGNLPTAATDAIFDANSGAPGGYTVTVNAAFACKNLNFSAAPSGGGTITFAGTNNVTVAGNITMLAGMTRTFGGQLFFTGGILQTITSNGVSFNSVLNISTAGTTVRQIDAFSLSGGNVVVANATAAWDGNGQNFTWAGSSFNQVGGVGTTTFGNLTFTSQSGINASQLILNGHITVTGMLTLTGVSNARPMSVTSGNAGAQNLGVPRTVTVNGAIALSDVDFQDVTAAGPLIPWTGTRLCDALGNSNITFQAPVTRYWVTNVTNALYSATTSWAASSGGASGASVPRCQDTVRFDANSGSLVNRIIRVDTLRPGTSLDFTGVTGNPIFQVESPIQLFGSITLAAGMQWTGNQAVGLQARGPFTITCNGVTFIAQFQYIGPNSTCNLADDYFGNTVGGVHFNISPGAGGVFNTNNHNMRFTSGTSCEFRLTTGTINFGSSLLEWYAPGATWNCVGGTVNAGTSIFKLGLDNGPLGKNFIGGTKIYYNVWFTGTGTGALSISGINGGNTFTIDTPPHTVFCIAGTSVTFANWVIEGRRATSTDVRFIDIVTSAVAQAPTTPKSVLNTLTGDLEVIAEIAPEDWTPVASRAIIYKGNGATIDIGFFVQNTTGRLVIQAFDTGGVQRSFISTVAPTITDGARLHVRATMDVNNGAGGSTAVFYTSPDGVTWTPLGTPVIVAATFTIRDTVGSFWLVGADAGSPGSPFFGQIYRVRVYNGIGGTIALNFNPADFATGSTWVAAVTGETWTLNGSCIISGTNMIALTSNGIATHVKSGGGFIQAKALSVKRSTASPASTFFADLQSLNGGNNTNWTFGTAFDTVGATSVAFAGNGVGATLYPSAGAAAIVLSVDGRAQSVTSPIGSAAMQFTVDGEGDTGYNWFDSVGYAEMHFSADGKYLPIPADRIFAVPPEVRRYAVPSEPRTFAVDAERRLTQ